MVYQKLNGKVYGVDDPTILKGLGCLTDQKVSVNMVEGVMTIVSAINSDTIYGDGGCANSHIVGSIPTNPAYKTVDIPDD